MKSFVACSIATLIAFAALTDPANAMKAYLSYIPNGSLFSQELGHPGNDSSQYTDFATAFEAVGLSWTADFCIDTFPNSDMTNGEAFGDPCCTWSQGGTPDFTVTPFTTNPTTATVCATSTSTAASTSTSSATTDTTASTSTSTSTASSAATAETSTAASSTSDTTTTSTASSSTTDSATMSSTSSATTDTSATTTTVPSTDDSTITGGGGCHAKPNSGTKSGKSGLLRDPASAIAVAAVDLPACSS